MEKYKTLSGATTVEIASRESLLDLLHNTPIPSNELLHNLGLYMNRQLLSIIFFIQELYQKILKVHGVIIEFGVRWGQNLSLNN